MNSSDNIYLIDNLNNTIVGIYKYVLPVLYIFGNIGNLLSLFIFLKKSWKKNVCVFYFKMCLLFKTCYINSTMLGTIFIVGFGTNLQNSSVVLCKGYYYISYLFATLSPTVLILASIDRLLISSQNVDTRLYSSKRLAYFSISISTVFWIIFNSHVLIKVSIQEFYPSYFVCYYDLSRSYFDFVTYSLTVINVVFSLLMIFLCVFSFKNVRRIRAIPREKRQQIRSMTKKDFQLIRCLFTQDIIYIISGTLITTYYIYASITQDQIQTPLVQTIQNFLSNFVTALYAIPYCTNILVFVTVSKSFRQELKRTMYKILGKEVIPIREEENRQENVERDNIEVNVVSTVVLPA